MRWKIIAVNSVIVLLVGLLSCALLRVSLADLVSNQGQLKQDAERALAAANAAFELDALRSERWLAGVVAEKSIRDPFKSGTLDARRRDSTDKANSVRSMAAASQQMAPSLVALVDSTGVVLGRDSSNLMRGEDVISGHPALKNCLEHGVTVSDVWADTKSAELMLVTCAPVRQDDGSTLGLVLLGMSLNDERLQRTSERTSGRPLILGIASNQQLELKAKSTAVPGPLLLVVGQGASKDAILGGLQTGRSTVLPGAPSDYILASAPLSGYGDGHRAALVSVVPTATFDVMGLLWPLIGVTLLGVLLVCVGGALLGNYIQRPISDLEEGLLAILNGRTDLRFEIEHADLGGVVFRLNSLLNQLMGVQEDDTDEEGRPSRPAQASDFSEALSVDEAAVAGAGVDPSISAALRAEPEDAYYRRLYNEYISAKRSIGDPVQHITEPMFVTRIKNSEADMRDKHGKEVRYRVELRGREVVLLAVPLA